MKARSRRVLAVVATTAIALTTGTVFGVAGAATTSPSGPTTVASQGFESNTAGFGTWLNDSTVARTTSGARSGVGALAVTTKSGASVRWSLAGSTFASGHNYTFSAWGRMSTATTAGLWGYVQFYDASWKFLGQTPLASAKLTNTAWTNMTNTFTVPARVAYVQLTVAGPKSAWVLDDATVVDNSVTAAPTTTTTTVAPSTTTTTVVPTTTTTVPPTTVPPTTTTTVPPTTTTTVPPTTTTPPAAGTRNSMLWPFASNSPWNTPIGSGAVYESATSTRTNGFRTWGVSTWMNAAQYSVPIYMASASDPVVTLNDTVHGVCTTARIPATAVPAAGSDSNMAIIQPDGRTIDIWSAKWSNSTTLTVSRYAWNSLTGSGLGPQGGIRASGLSTLGGLIRRWEADPADPNYTDGTIRHALAVAVPGNMLQWTGGNSGYDANGYGTAKGYVWPATEQDWGSESIYKGPLPLGSLLAIPKSVNVAALGLSPAGLKMAKALQDYGAYVVDMSGSSGPVTFYAEPTLATSSFYTQAIGPNYSAKDLTTLRNNMVVISNNSSTSVGGGGTPLAPTAPALG